MDTAEIVRRLLTRPVTERRALKVLHLLETPEQADEVKALVASMVEDESDRQQLIILTDALVENAVKVHFARRAR